MTFSARSFSLVSSSRASRASSAGLDPRGRVPLIGRVSIRRPRSSRKRSGLAETTAWSPAPMKPANGAGERRASDSKSASGSAVGGAAVVSTGTVQRCERFA